MRHDEEVKRVIKDDPMRRGSSEYSHPCFGMIRVSRITGGSGKLFGTETDCNSRIRLSIGQATVTQDLSCNWYHQTDVITEVEMSPVQYAEMISNPNTSGVPCTITQTTEKGHIVYRGIDTMTEFAEQEVDRAFNQSKKMSAEAVKEITELLSQKSIKKADKQAVINIASNLVQQINSNLPFYEKSVKENIERTKMEAKAEIESYVAHAITRAGIESINSGVDLVKLMTNSGESRED